MSMLKAGEYRGKAGDSHKAGKAVLAEIDEKNYMGTELTEKQAQAQAHFDDVDKHIKSAELLEKAEGHDDYFTQQSKTLKLGAYGTPEGVEVSEERKELIKELGLGEVKRYWATITEKKGILGDLDAAEYYSNAENRKDFHRALQTAQYWKSPNNQLNPIIIKALSTAPGAAGGFIVADTQTSRFIELLTDFIQMRTLSTVLPPIPGGSSVSPAEDTDFSDADWTTEILTGSQETVNPFGARVLNPKPVAKQIRLSRTLLRAATLLDVDSWVMTKLSQKFAETHEEAFLNGDGTNRPLGVLSDEGISDYETAAANTLAADDIINWTFTLAAKYLQRATMLFNQSFLRKTRLLKGSDNNYLWQPGLQQGLPQQILGVPYLISDRYPTGLTSDAFDNNALIATIADWSFYWIQDSLAFSVQRLEELYAATNQVGFIGRAEADGQPVRTEAFLHLKIKSA